MKTKPPFQPTRENREMVTLLSSMGVPQDDISKVVGISKMTLVKYFREELDTAAIRANAKVAGTLFKAATNPEGGSSSVTAAIFWLKTRARWKETAAVELSGADGDPLITEIRRTIIDPRHTDTEGLPPATE